MGSATGSSMRAAKQMHSSAGYFDKLHMAKADNLAFNAIAAAHGKGLLKVSIDGRSHNLLSDVGPGTFTLGLNTTVQRLWEDKDRNAVDTFAGLLGSVQKVASNLLNHFDNESDAQQSLNQWIEATQKAENIHDSAEACQFAKDAGAVGADGC